MISRALSDLLKVGQVSSEIKPVKRVSNGTEATNPTASPTHDLAHVSAADSSQSSTGYECLKLFSMKYCLSPGPFQKAFKQLLVH
jgi:hypothetical protein